MSKPTKITNAVTKNGKTIASNTPADAAIDAMEKRASIIALCKAELIAVAKCQESLAKAKLPAMNDAEVNAYVDTTITTADIVGELPPVEMSVPVGLGKKPKADKPAAAPEGQAVPQPVINKHLRTAIDITSGLLKATCPERIAEYKALKHAGKRAEAYGFALRCLVEKFPTV